MEQSLPDESSEDFVPILFYKARAHIALGDTKTVASLIPEDTENLALKAVAVFANYISSPTGDAALEELRDLCVEIEGDDVDASEREKGWVRVVAGTAFARASEVEEALETLGAESTTENPEAYVPHQRVNAPKCATNLYLQLANSDPPAFSRVAFLVLLLPSRFISLSTARISHEKSSSARSNGPRTT